MIKSFRDKDTEAVFERQPVRGLPVDIQRRALRKLLVLDAAEELVDLLTPPGNHLEKLTGNRAGEHSIRINDQWRICFHWRRGHAFEVEIVDYH